MQSTDAEKAAIEAPEATKAEEKQQGGKLTLDEERETGEVSWATYKHYLKAIGTWWWSVVIFSTLIAVEGSRTVNSLFLGFWSGRRLRGFTTGEYMAVYAGGFEFQSYCQALVLICVSFRARWRYCSLHGMSRYLTTGCWLISQWVSVYVMIIAGNRASFRMFEDAWERVMRSPSGWHDRTPVSISVGDQRGPPD